jgi:mono/diheme cytochrome c family protein
MEGQMLRTGIVIGMMFFASAAVAADGVSVKEGLRIATIGGCHDCHTDGFAASGGKIDPEKALKGSQVGYQGPWGTTYPANLRLVLSKMTEDEFVRYGHEVKTRPPMPWFGLHAMTDNELRSIYQYVKSLGEPGEPAPEYVKPGESPKTPFIVFAPPQMPAK